MRYASGTSPPTPGESTMRCLRQALAPSHVIALALAMLQVAAAAPPAAPAGEGGSAPAASGLIERSEVRLMLLEVEAVDKEGHPLRGLTQADFVVVLGGRRAVIESVDDLCGCAGPPPAGSEQPAIRAAAPAGDAAPSPSGSESPAGAPADTGSDRFVLYFDFGQMALDGRHEAIKAARRWIAEVKQPAEQAMIAAYVTDKGIEILEAFTASSADLLRSLDRAERNLGLVDHFAVQLQRRLEDCSLDPTTCKPSAREEYEHGRRSLTGLQQFLTRLAVEPGRKAVLFFHENGLMSPGRIYRRRPDEDPLNLRWRVPDQFNLADRVAAEATSARAVLYPVKVGVAGGGSPTVEEENLTLGGDLSEATGGRYNRGPGDLAALVDRAGRGCRCLYLLGLRPPERTGSRVYSATIRARGVTLAPRYRVRFLTDEERWIRNAQAVLADPLSSRKIGLGAAIVPIEAVEGRWRVAVQVVTETDALVLIPQGGAGLASWEVGALLVPLDGRRKWEMLGTVTLRRDTPESGSRSLLHERIIDGLRPGPYRFTTFIRDRTASDFGGAEARLTLPDPAEGGVAGPILFRPWRRQIVSELPLLTTQGRPELRTGHETVGRLPAEGTTVRRGDPLEIRTWLCPGRSGRPMEGILRYLTKGESPAFRFGDLVRQPAGQCSSVTDQVDTSRLDGGRYTYHLRWPGEPARPHTDATISFEVSDPAARASVDSASVSR